MLEYFEGTENIFLLKIPSLLRGYPLKDRCLIETRGLHLGVLYSIFWQQQQERLLEYGGQFFAAHKNDDGSTSEDSVSYSAGYDREGKAYAEGSISHETWDQDGYSSSIELKGGVSLDRDGNTNAEIKVEGTISW